MDGVQRLSTIHEFVRGKHSFKLEYLEYLEKELLDARFSDIERTNWSRRIFTTQIAANVIDPQTPVAVKFDIFRRINTGGSPLNAQEIRHCMSRSRSRSFLATLCSLPSFTRAVGKKVVNQKRMMDRELALRFAAFSLLDHIDDYQKFNSMDEFLTEMNRNIDDKKAVSNKKLDQLTDNFSKAMETAVLLFGEHAFRRWPLTVSDLYPVNRALFDAWSVLLSRVNQNSVIQRKATIVKASRTAMTDDDEFIAAISTGTSSPARVSLRFERVADFLE